MASILNSISTAVPAPLAHLFTRLLLLGFAASLATPLLCVLLSSDPFRLAPRWSRRIPARLRFRVLAASFALMLAAPLLTAYLPAASILNETWPTSPHLFSHALAATAAHSVSHPVSSMRVLPVFASAVALLWLLASASFALRLFRDFLRVRQLRRSAQPLHDEIIANQPCPIAISTQISSPCLTGLFSPLVLLPASLPAQLAPSQLAAILEHEFAHLRRHDPLTNLLQKLALVAFPLHPGLHLLDRWMSREREHACDEWVLLRSHAACDYAASLVDVASAAVSVAAFAAPLAAVGSRSELSSRIERIVRPVPALPRRLAATLAILLTAGSASLAALLIHLTPSISFSPVNATNHSANHSYEQAARSSTEPANSYLPPAPRMVLTAFREPAPARPEEQSLATPGSSSRRAHSPVRAVNTAWGEPAPVPLPAPATRHPAPRQPVLEASLSNAQPVEEPVYALVVESTTITESSFVIGPASLGPEDASLPQPTPSAQATAIRAAQPTEQKPRQASESAPATRQIFYSIVTTTLRITPAEHIRLEQAWLARKL